MGSVGLVGIVVLENGGKDTLRIINEGPPVEICVYPYDLEPPSEDELREAGRRVIERI